MTILQNNMRIESRTLAERLQEFEGVHHNMSTFGRKFHDIPGYKAYELLNQTTQDYSTMMMLHYCKNHKRFESRQCLVPMGKYYCFNYKFICFECVFKLCFNTIHNTLSDQKCQLVNICIRPFFIPGKIWPGKF